MKDPPVPRPPRTDAELVSGLIARDRPCTEEFLARFTPLLHRAVARRFARHALGRGLHVPDVQDCVQSVLVSLLENNATRLRSYRPDEAPLRAWLWAVASNHASQSLASRARSGTHELPQSAGKTDAGTAVEGSPIGGALPIDEQARLEARQELAYLFQQLGDEIDDDDRTLLRLRFIDDEPTDVICDRLKLSSDAFYQRLSRLRKLFREVIARGKQDDS